MEDLRDYRLTAYLFGSLSARGRAEVEAHLAGCARCRRELADLRRTLGLAKAALSTEEEAAGALEPARMARVLGARRGKRAWPYRLAGIAASAAVMLLVLGHLLISAKGPGPRATDHAVTLDRRPQSAPDSMNRQLATAAVPAPSDAARSGGPAGSGARSVGVNDAIGIGGGAAGAYGQRWGRAAYRRPRDRVANDEKRFDQAGEKPAGEKPPSAVGAGQRRDPEESMHPPVAGERGLLELKDASGRRVAEKDEAGAVRTRLSGGVEQQLAKAKGAGAGDRELEPRGADATMPAAMPADARRRSAAERTGGFHFDSYFEEAGASEGKERAATDLDAVAALDAGNYVLGGFAKAPASDERLFAGKPAAPPARLPTGAEPLLRAYAHYRTLGANLDLRGFTARVVPVPPPSLESENLTEEEFRARYRVNPFVDTRVDRLSTFGMDVDTASYTRARDALRAGRLPEPESVRVEEFVNYFPGDYVTDPEASFSVYCEGGPSPFGAGLDLLKIAVKARELRPNERKNAVITFAVDVSGSMAARAGGGAAVGTGPTRLDLAAHALGALVDALGPEDRVAIVAYGTYPALILPHTPVRERRRILGAIASLAPGGATNLEAGLDLAYRVADEAFDAKALNRVILCSDGVANLGARGPEEILKKVVVFARRGIYLSAVGFGRDSYDDAMLGLLADKGNGNYRYVDSPEEAARIFNEDLPKTLDVLAQDAKIQVVFNPEVVSRYRLLGYEKRAIKDEDFRNDKVDAGEVGPGATVTVLYEIQRRTNPQGDIGRIHLRYRDAGTGRIEETDYPLSAGVLAVNLRDTTDRFRFVAAAAETAELLRESYFARDGSFEKTAALLASAGPEFKARRDWVELNELVLRAWKLTLERLEALAATL